MNTNNPRSKPRQHLTAEQEAFAVRIVQGDTQAQAYNTAYGSNLNQKSLVAEGGRVADYPRVQARIAKIFQKRRNRDGGVVFVWSC